MAIGGSVLTFSICLTSETEFFPSIYLKVTNGEIKLEVFVMFWDLCVMVLSLDFYSFVLLKIDVCLSEFLALIFTYRYYIKGSLSDAPTLSSTFFLIIWLGEGGKSDLN